MVAHSHGLQSTIDDQIVSLIVGVAVVHKFSNATQKIHLLDKNMKKNAVLNACVNPKPVKGMP